MDVIDNFSLIKEEIKKEEDLTEEEIELAKKYATEDWLYERIITEIVNNRNEIK